MKLAQILIQAGVTPIDLHPDCKFIAQDGGMGIFSGLVYEYENIPKMCFTLKNLWLVEGIIGNISNIFDLSDDWQTPLSREQFIADYEAHCAKRP